MRKLLICIAAVPLIAVAIACKHDDTSQQATAPTATGYPTAYPPPTATYPYPTAQPTGYPTAQPTAYPTAQPTVAPTGGQMATPGPFAFTCQNDVPCGTHHCNMQYQKCAFPCQTAVDCLAPNSCVMGVCVPAPPAQH
jgi:hypothetical protein